MQKPSLVISASNEMLQHTDDSTIHLKPVCNGCSNEITLKLTGEAPFVVDYEINLPSGKMETHSMNIDTHDITIKLPTRSNGRFEHQFKHVYDRLYTKPEENPQVYMFLKLFMTSTHYQRHSLCLMIISLKYVRINYLKTQLLLMFLFNLVVHIHLTFC